MMCGNLLRAIIAIRGAHHHRLAVGARYQHLSYSECQMSAWGLLGMEDIARDWLSVVGGLWPHRGVKYLIII